MVWISWYGLLYQVYMLTNFVTPSRSPCALITNFILGNSGFGDLVKLLHFRWPLNVMVIFLYFCLQSNEIRISSSPFRIDKNMKSGV